jgi:hypothetical protein
MQIVKILINHFSILSFFAIHLYTFIKRL